MNRYKTLLGILYLYRKLVQVIALGLFVFYAFTLAFDWDYSEYTIGVLVLVTSIVEISLVIGNPHIYKSGLLMIFYSYNILCHNGFVIARLFDDSYEQFQSSISMSFLDSAYFHTAIYIANIVLLAFAFGNELNIKGSVIPSYYWKETTEVNDEGSKKADIIGIVALFGGTLHIAYLILSRGLFLAGYTTFLSVAEGNSFYGFVVIITSLSMALILAAGTRKGIRIGIIIYAVLTILQFSVGNRGEVLYSAIVCFALYSMRFKNIKLKHVIVVLAISVAVIPLVRISRELRIEGYIFNPITSLLDVLCEEGIQISPFTCIVSYVKSSGGHPHVWGMTYINDFVDFITRRFGGSSPFSVEQYVIKSIMPRNGMGFSMIAELYYNFSVVGAAIIYFILARVINRIDWNIYNNLYSNNKKIVISMFFVELINLTRNDASTLPLYLFFTLLLYCLFILLSGSTGRRTVGIRKTDVGGIK